MLPPGMKLPSREELSREFQVSLDTTQRAVEVLKRERFLFARRKAGTFVAEHPPHLYDFGIVFLGAKSARTTSNYWHALAEAAEAFEPQGPRRIHVFDQVVIETSATYKRLKHDVLNRRLAGLIFATAPNELNETPIVTFPGIPRIAISEPKGCPPGVRSMEVDMGKFFDAAMSALAKRGRRRIGVIAHNFEERWIIDLLTQSVNRFGLTLNPRWMQAPSFHPIAVRNCAMLLAGGAPGERPDGLLILDDNLVESATEGLVCAKVRVPEDIDVVAHANFPLVTPSRVPAVRVGWNVPALLARCVERLASDEAHHEKCLFEPEIRPSAQEA
jgi:DNA-binding LacI/PurR family transcriptional regulator